MIAPASLAPLARALVDSLSPSDTNMFVSALSPSGLAPATHFISSGMLDSYFADLLVDDKALYKAVSQAGASVTQAECTALVYGSDVSTESTSTAMDRLGLKQIQTSAL